MDPIIAYIDKFDGNGNFILCKNHVYLVLHAKGVAHAVENDLRYDDGNGNFVFDIDDSKANGTASIIIRSCLAPEYTNYDMNLKAFELWAELDMLFSSAKTSKIVAQLSKLLACKMQPGDKNGRTFTATFKSIVQAMDSSDLSYDQLVTLIYLSSLNDEFRPVATHFGTIKPTLFTLQKVATMVCEHTDTLMASVDQDSSVFADASQNNVVCQYCSKPGHTAAISKDCNDIGIDNVLYTPGSAMNLLSVSRLTESDLDTLFRKGKAYVRLQGQQATVCLK
ncbi:hypothetical protein IWW37_000892 [Coemansia sp. RSA 2050]|nr:hypothetical protein IWW37_000892 [Coemansia sp. RSA 2050]